MVARLLATATLWVRIQTSQKFKNGRRTISKEVANTLKPSQKIYKKGFVQVVTVTRRLTELPKEEAYSKVEQR